MSIGTSVTADSNIIAPLASPHPVYPRPASRRYRSSSPETWSLERPSQQVEGICLALQLRVGPSLLKTSCRGKRLT